MTFQGNMTMLVNNFLVRIINSNTSYIESCLINNVIRLLNNIIRLLDNVIRLLSNVIRLLDNVIRLYRNI